MYWYNHESNHLTITKVFPHRYQLGPCRQRTWCGACVDVWRKRCVWKFNACGKMIITFLSFQLTTFATIHLQISYFERLRHVQRITINNYYTLLFYIAKATPLVLLKFFKLREPSLKMKTWFILFFFLVTISFIQIFNISSNCCTIAEKFWFNLELHLIYN